jgi:hypothetical protein
MPSRLTLPVVSQSSGIERDQDVSFEIFPNPADEEVILRNVPAGADVSVYDMTNRKLDEFIVGGNAHRYTIRHFPSGIYLLHMQINGRFSTWKLIIVNGN